MKKFIFFPVLRFSLFSFLLGVRVCLGVEIVAHRGASAAAPENTLPAFKLAWEQGAHHVEGDFLTTSDNVIVCFHDQNTKRLCGEDRLISSSTYAELQELDVGAWMGEKWKGTRIPTLSEVLDVLPPDGGRLFLEIKDNERIIKPLVSLLEKRPELAPRLAILCFKEEIITACKEVLPAVDAHWLLSFKSYEKLGEAEVIKKALRIGADGIDLQAHLSLDSSLGKSLKENGLEFHCWTVNEDSLARHMQQIGVDSLTTDKPRDMKNALRGMKEQEPPLCHLSFNAESEGPAGINGKGFSLRSSTLGNSSSGAYVMEEGLPTSGTVTLWYRPEGWYDFQTVFDSTAHQDVWELWMNKEGQIGFRTTGDDLRMTYQLHPIGALNQWVFLGVSWDDKEVALSINGVVVAKKVRKNPTSPIGKFALGGGHIKNVPGRGTWDEVMIFKRVLSAAELHELMLSL